jgi:threonine/homoserine efflux transporter RhtA
MDNHRSTVRTVRFAALVAIPLEASCLWSLYSLFQFGQHGGGLHGHGAIVDWSMLVAFVVHVPPAMIAPGDGVAFWSVLFLGGYCEWFLLIAAIGWGYREARSVSTLLRQYPQSPW